MWCIIRRPDDVASARRDVATTVCGVWAAGNGDAAGAAAGGAGGPGGLCRRRCGWSRRRVDEVLDVRVVVAVGAAPADGVLLRAAAARRCRRMQHVGRAAAARASPAPAVPTAVDVDDRLHGGQRGSSPAVRRTTSSRTQQDDMPFTFARYLFFCTFSVSICVLCFCMVGQLR